MDMDNIIQTALGSTTLTPTGRGGGGCINHGEAYMVDTGTVFVKSNSKKNAKLMFDGELEGLLAISATQTVTVPRPIISLDNPNGGAALVLEFVDLKGLRTFSKQMGHDLAKMHLHNLEQNERRNKKSGFVSEKESEENGSNAFDDLTKFGFHVPTCCGYIPMENSWKDDWVEFYAQNRLEAQIKKIEKDYGDRETLELWSQLQLKIPNFFTGLSVQASLLHGDLWSGNVAETATGPVAFDPAVFYGHHEFDLAIASMFGGFTKTFYKEYHSLIPESPGFHERLNLYKLFHYLNHWNHFGTGYRDSSLKLMKSLVK